MKDKTWAYWLLIAASLLGMLHITLTPFFERQFFGDIGFKLLFIALIVSAIFVALGRGPLNSKELAIVLAGFISNWLILCPCWFYTAAGEQWTPRPHADLIAGIFESAALLVPGWAILGGCLLKRRWWLMVPAGLVQCWIAFVSLFLVAGCVTGRWV